MNSPALRITPLSRDNGIAPFGRSIPLPSSRYNSVAVTSEGYNHEGNRSLIHQPQLREIRKKLPLRVLAETDWEHWTTWGYVVVPDVVPAEDIERLKTLLWQFQELDPDDPESWNRSQLRSNRMVELNNTGMVEIYNHQYLWDNRQQRPIYDAFVDIWDREDLWVTIDRANLNTPNRGRRPFDGFIHWDVDTTQRPLPVNVQGVLSLTDTDEVVGGFQCVPELFRNFDEWEKTQAPGRDPFHPDLAGLETKFVPTRAGDLLIFNSLTPHGIRANRSKNRARIAQYVSMYPCDQDNPEAVATRVRSWREREAPQGPAFPGDPRGWEKTRYETATLNHHGRKLLGMDRW